MIKDTAHIEKRIDYLLECHSDTVHAIAWYTKKRNEITAELISLKKEASNDHEDYEARTGHKVGFLKDESVEVRAAVLEAIKAAHTKNEEIEAITLVVRHNAEDREKLDGLTRYAIEALDRQRYRGGHIV